MKGPFLPNPEEGRAKYLRSRLPSRCRLRDLKPLFGSCGFILRGVESGEFPEPYWDVNDIVKYDYSNGFCQGIDLHINGEED